MTGERAKKKVNLFSTNNIGILSGCAPERVQSGTYRQDVENCEFSENELYG